MPGEIELHTDSIAETGIAIDSLGVLYPYIVVFQEDSLCLNSSVSEHLAGWKNPSGINAQLFTILPGKKVNILAEKNTHSIKDMYPGQEGTPVYRGIQTEIWFTPLMFLMFIAYGLVFFRKKKMLLQDIKEFFTLSFKSDAFKKNSFTDNYRSKIVLTCTGIINISLFAFFAVSRLFNYDTENIPLVFVLLLAATTLYLWFKIAMIKLICYVFLDKRSSFIGRKTFYSLFRFLGILLIPVVLFLAFGSIAGSIPVIYAGLFFGICLLILYISKITAFFFQDVFSLFYLILYLCTLEILPVIIFLNELISIVAIF
jgi:hypothetical protein